MHESDEIDPMGWRISGSVVRGEIDGRVRDRVTGKIWLIDRDFPIEIQLRGNPLRDIAGCVLAFENPEPVPEDNEGLCPVQMGQTGNITASRKVRICDWPFNDENAAVQQETPNVKRIGNAVYIEWFSNANGRVVVESTDFNIHVSNFAWRMTPDEERQQIQQNQTAQERWREIIAFEEEDDDGMDDGYEWEMDEFDWEKQLRESDAITDRYMQLMEKYLDHPDRERIIAREMGWNWPEDAMDEEEDDSIFAGFSDDQDDDDTEDNELPSLDPNPLTEGRDWIRTRDGSVRHPLSHRAITVAIGMWHNCKERGLTGEGADPDLHNMLFHAQTLGAKLAGTLNALAYDSDPDGGFIVACLKRALKIFEQAITSSSLVSQKALLPAPDLQRFRDDLFTIREKMLALMHHFRQTS